MPDVPASWRSRRLPVLLRALAALAIVSGAALFTIAQYAGTTLVVAKPLADPDAIVSLASHEWERLPETARLARQYPDARVLLTLPRPVSEYNCHDCAGRVGRLVHMGVPAARIVILPLARSNTRGEASAALDFARTEGLRRLLVVTSPYHTRRSLVTFRQVMEGSGIEVGVTPAAATSPADPARWWRTPYDRWYVRYEWMALTYYLVRYGVDPRA